MLPQRKFPPKVAAPPSPAAVAERNKKSYKERSFIEKLRGMSEKNWERMGKLEALQFDQARRHHELGSHAPLEKRDYSKGIFQRDLLAGTIAPRV